MSILSIDVGFGSTKLAYVDASGTMRFKKYITALAQKQVSGVFVDEESVEMNGNQYLCFDRAVAVPGSQQIQVVDFESLKLATPIFIKKIEADLNMKFDTIVAGLSIAMIERHAEYKAAIVDNLGLDPNKVVILQQGVGGWAAYQSYGLDPYQVSDSSMIMKNYLLIDIGHNTMDVLSVIGGKLSEDTIDGITGAGTMWIADKLIKYLYKEYKMDITPVNAREMLDKKYMKYRGTTVDLSGVLADIAYEYCQFIVNTIESKFANSMNSRDGLLFIGGTSYIIHECIKSDPRVAELFDKRYGQYFITIPQHAEFYNASGYYLLARKMMSK